MKSKPLCFLLTFCWFVQLSSQDITGHKLIEESCAYHDPEMKMLEKGIRLHLEEPRQGQKPRLTTLDINPSKAIYKIKQLKDGNTSEYIFNKEKLTILFNGNRNFSEEEKEKYKLTTERGELLKNYYYYLWFLPCQLLEPGAQIEDKVRQVSYNKEQVLEVRVSYPTQENSDEWRFYFRPDNYALAGYMFFNKKSDGEYIILEGEAKYKDIRLPAERSWYDNHDEQYLATDKLVDITKFKKP